MNTDSDQCKTITGGPQEHVPCIFPFTFGDKEHNKCIWQGTDKPWCSTKVDREGLHVDGQGQWGYCGSQCPITTQGDNYKITFYILSKN